MTDKQATSEPSTGKATKDNVASLLNLEQQLRQASSPQRLFYTIVNQTHDVVPYTQAVLLQGNTEAQLKVVAASDIPAIDYTSPFTTWIEKLSHQLCHNLSALTPQPFNLAQADETLKVDWQDLSPDYLLLIPLPVAAQEGKTVGVLMLFRSEPWTTQEQTVLSHLAGTIAHALFAWQRQQPVKDLLGKLRQSKITTAVLLGIVLLMCLPVRLSALAPFKVIPNDPVILTAPINGAVKNILVQPNQQVGQGDLLVQFEDTELASEYEVAQQALLVAQAELKTIQQSGFLDPTKKARLAELASKVRLKQAETTYALSRYKKSRLNASASGIAVLSDPDEWSGKPVSIGERIMLLADPASVEIEIMLPAGDAISLSENADIRLFPDSSPLNVTQAQLRYSSYEPELTPDKQLAYRLVAVLDPTIKVSDLPRIGARGTAKLYGEQVSLFYYLFRRPLTSARQWLGW